MNVVEQMIVSRTALTHKDHLSAHVLKDLHLMIIIRHVLVSYLLHRYYSTVVDTKRLRIRIVYGDFCLQLLQ